MQHTHLIMEMAKRNKWDLELYLLLSSNISSMLCNPEDAAVVIQENMTFDTNSPNFAAVKSAVEIKL